MMSPRPPPQPPPPPLTHLRQLLSPDSIEPASSLPGDGRLPPLRPPPPPPIQRAHPGSRSVKNAEKYPPPSNSSYRPPLPLQPPPPPPPPRHLIPSTNTSIPIRPTLPSPLSAFRPTAHSSLHSPATPATPLAPPTPPSHLSPEDLSRYSLDAGVVTYPEPFIEPDQGRRRSIPPLGPPPLPSPRLQNLHHPRSDGTLASPISEFAVPRYVNPVGQSISPRNRKLSSSSLLVSPSRPTSKGKKRGFEDILTEDKKISKERVASRGISSSESAQGTPILRPMSDRLALRVRQQPVAARACGFGERDRRVIDPPPIVQLVAIDPSAAAEIKYPFNVVHCTLWNMDGTSDETALEQPDKRITRRLMGTLVSSPFIGLDENGEEGCYFCFPDLSCRTHGQFRLKFVLLSLNPMGEQSSYTPVTTEVMSDVFTVYTAKEFPGMRPSTNLTKALKRQGCTISVKKGNEKATLSSTQEEDEEEKSGEGDESDQDQASSSRGKRRKKT